jgi:hypothetical protein
MPCTMGEGFKEGIYKREWMSRFSVAMVVASCDCCEAGVGESGQSVCGRVSALAGSRWPQRIGREAPSICEN